MSPKKRAKAEAQAQPGIDVIERVFNNTPSTAGSADAADPTTKRHRARKVQVQRPGYERCNPTKRGTEHAGEANQDKDTDHDDRSTKVYRADATSGTGKHYHGKTSQKLSATRTTKIRGRYIQPDPDHGGTHRYRWWWQLVRKTSNFRTVPSSSTGQITFSCLPTGPSGRAHADGRGRDGSGGCSGIAGALVSNAESGRYGR